MRKFEPASRLPKILAPLVFLFALLGSGLPASASAADELGANTVAAIAAAPPLFRAGVYPPGADTTVARDAQVTRSRPVNIDFKLLTASADSATAGGQLVALNLFDDVTVVARADRIESTARGINWIGHVPGVPMSQVVIVVNGDTVAGNISMLMARYHIRYAGNGVHEVQRIDQTLFPRDEKFVPVPDQNVLNAAAAKDAVSAQYPAAQADDGSQIDVMVVYSATTRAAAGGTGAMQTLIDLAVSETNQSYINSGVTQRLRLVRAEEVAYTETGNLETALNCITSTTDGCLDSVHTLRNTYGADLVSFWVEDGGSYCGLAWMMSSVSSSFAGNGFSTVARSCATGYYSFGHELGHNMGARHDVYVDAESTPYSYAHGYTNPGAAAPWRTIMAYNNACADVGKNCTRIQYWSNPSVTYSGAAMGNASADNHQALNNTAVTIANFRTSVSAPACSYTLDPAGLTASAAGAAGNVSVTAATGCAWTAVSNASWITITAGASGSGSGLVSYSVSANTGASSRSGSVTIAGQTFTVTQAGASCSYALSAASQTASVGGTSGSVGVTAAAGCTWTAVSNASWISVTSGASGSGSGSVGFSVAANTGTATRSGTITIAGQGFTITQAAAPAVCVYTISPGSQALGSNSANGGVTVTTSDGCTWTAASNAAWLSISSGASSSGSGVAGYAASANTGTASRTGTLTVAGNTFTVTQGATSYNTVRNAFFVNASTSSNKTSVIRVINIGSQSGAIAATAYNEAGSVVGTSNFVLGTPSAQQMLTFTSAQLEAAIGYVPSSSTAKYRIAFNGNLPSFEVLNFVKDVATGNLTLGQAQVDNRAAGSAAASTRHALFVNASSSSNKTSVLRLINTTGQSGTVTASAYDEAGNAVGIAGASLGTLAAQQMLTFTSAQLESALAFTPASSTAKYRVEFSANLSNFEVLNFIKDVATGNLTLGQDQID